MCASEVQLSASIPEDLAVAESSHAAPSGHSLVVQIAVDNSLVDVSPLASPSGALVVREDANLTHTASASSQPNVARIAQFLLHRSWTPAKPL